MGACGSKPASSAHEATTTAAYPSYVSPKEDEILSFGLSTKKNSVVLVGWSPLSSPSEGPFLSNDIYIYTHVHAHRHPLTSILLVRCDSRHHAEPSYPVLVNAYAPPPGAPTSRTSFHPVTTGSRPTNTAFAAIQKATGGASLGSPTKNQSNAKWGSSHQPSSHACRDDFDDSPRRGGGRPVRRRPPATVVPPPTTDEMMDHVDDPLEAAEPLSTTTEGDAREDSRLTLSAFDDAYHTEDEGGSRHGGIDDDDHPRATHHQEKEAESERDDHDHTTHSSPLTSTHSPVHATASVSVSASPPWMGAVDLDPAAPEPEPSRVSLYDHDTEEEEEEEEDDDDDDNDEEEHNVDVDVDVDVDHDQVALFHDEEENHVAEDEEEEERFVTSTNTNTSTLGSGVSDWHAMKSETHMYMSGDLEARNHAVPETTIPTTIPTPPVRAPSDPNDPWATLQGEYDVVHLHASESVVAARPRHHRHAHHQATVLAMDAGGGGGGGDGHGAGAGAGAGGECEVRVVSSSQHTGVLHGALRGGRTGASRGGVSAARRDEVATDLAMDDLEELDMDVVEHVDGFQNRSLAAKLANLAMLEDDDDDDDDDDL